MENNTITQEMLDSLSEDNLVVESESGNTFSWFNPFKGEDADKAEQLSKLVDELLAQYQKSNGIHFKEWAFGKVKLSEVVKEKLPSLIEQVRGKKVHVTVFHQDGSKLLETTGFIVNSGEDK